MTRLVVVLFLVCATFREHWWEGVKMALTGPEVWVSLGLFLLVLGLSWTFRPRRPRSR